MITGTEVENAQRLKTAQRLGSVTMMVFVVLLLILIWWIFIGIEFADQPSNEKNTSPLLKVFVTPLAQFLKGRWVAFLLSFVIFFGTAWITGRMAGRRILHFGAGLWPAFGAFFLLFYCIPILIFPVFALLGDTDGRLYRRLVNRPEEWLRLSFAMVAYVVLLSAVLGTVYRLLLKWWSIKSNLEQIKLP